jgi:glycine/D-amino acid oxidase-like deaminating enzyme
MGGRLPRRADLLVAGGGIAGTTTVHFLAERGVSVVLRASAVASSRSGVGRRRCRSTACLASRGVSRLRGRDRLLRPGFGIGPGAGRLVAALVTGNEPFVDPTPFRFPRFSDGSRPRLLRGI